MTTENPDRVQTVTNDSSARVIGSVVQTHSVQDVYISNHDVTTVRFPVPRQLPPSAGRFVNRTPELDLLTRLVARGTAQLRPVVAILSGMSGVGKSATAAQWANAHADRFAGGQLYADMSHYRNRGGVDVNEVLGAFLRALGVHNDYLPTDFSERVALFRSRTVAQPYLVVLDDVDHAAQVRPFLPGSADSALIVTSKRRLSSLVVDGAELVEVRPLNTGASMQLIDRMIGNGQADSERDALAELAALCAGLPIALRVAGIRLTERRRWPIRRLVQRLAKESSRLNELSVGGDYDVAAVFDLAYAELPPPIRRIYCDLGLHPGPDFSADLVAAGADVPLDSAEESLAVLCEANLVEESDTDRYRFHDLVPLHARQQAERDQPRNVRERVLGRIVDWYSLGAAAADRAVLGEARWRLARPDLSRWRIGFDPSSAMKWFETERANLLAVVRSAATHQRYEKVWQLCEALWAFYHSRKHYPDWIETNTLGVAAAEQLGEDAAQARMHNHLARAYLELAEYDRAGAELTRAWEVAVRSGDPRAQAAVLESAGLLARDQHHYPDALNRFRQAWAIFEDLDDQRGVALQAYQLGDVLLRDDQPGDAVPVLQDALDLLSRLNDDMTASRVRIVLGRAYFALGRNDDARSELSSAVAVASARRQPVKEAQALEAMMAVAEQDHDVAVLERSARRLVHLYAENGNPRSTALIQLLAEHGLSGND